MSATHYENFPVASVLCPPSIRPAVKAIYQFARTADDIADEGTASASERRAELDLYLEDLHRCAQGAAPSPRWPRVFGTLAPVLREFALPLPLLEALLDAFRQDVRNPAYASRTDLLDYCSRSADPVGRLLLHLYGIDDDRSLRQSDAICSALQLTNFWQDLSVDLPRGRCYVPAQDAVAHGLDPAQVVAGADTPATRALVRELVAWTRERMLAGAPLARRLPGRIGWELRLVVQGGLRILEKIGRMDHAALSHRPTLGRLDAPVLLWRAATMAGARE